MSDLFKEGYEPPPLPEGTAAFYQALTDEMAIYTCVNDFIIVAMRHAVRHGEPGIDVKTFSTAITSALQQLGFHR